jgi:hypothetical protein
MTWTSKVLTVSQNSLDHSSEGSKGRRRPTRAEENLRAALGARKGDQRGRDVVVDDLLILPLELLDEAPGQRRVGSPMLHTVRTDDVHGVEFGAGARRDARGASKEHLIDGTTRDADDESLTGLPGLGDVVIVLILLNGVFDTIGQPEQREFSKRTEVSHAEVVRQ